MNRVLDRTSAEEIQRIGVHTCPGGDLDSTHSADVDYADLLPDLFALNAGNFFIALAGEQDRAGSCASFGNAPNPISASLSASLTRLRRQWESPEQVRDRVLEAAEFIAPGRLGTTDDCGFSRVEKDTSASRDIAFEKIRARVLGTALATEKLGLKPR